MDAVYAIGKRDTTCIEYLAPGCQRFLPEVPRPIHHLWIGQIGLEPLGLKPSLPGGIVAVDQDDAGIRYLRSGQGLLNESNPHLPLKENGSSGAQYRPNLLHPGHSHGALPSSSRLVTGAILSFHLL